MFGIINFDYPRTSKLSGDCISKNISAVFNSFTSFLYDWERNTSEELKTQNEEFKTFIHHHKVRTTNKNEKTWRIKFLSKYFLQRD